MDTEALAVEQGIVAERAIEDNKLRESLSPIDRQYAPQPNMPRRIHIIGTGSIGKLIAHSLRGIENPPPVTLIFHRYKLLQAWEKSKKVITVQDDEYTVERDGFDVELAPEYRRVHGIKVVPNEPDVYSLSDETGVRPDEVARIISQQREAAIQQQRADKDVSEYQPFQEEELQAPEIANKRPEPGDYAVSTEPIHTLIVTTKTIRTTTALLAIKHRMTKDTTICFLQNGMGVIDDVNKEVFPNEATRPNYVQGIISHGANVPPEKAEHDPFFVVHAGHGTISLGVVPKHSLANSSDRPPTPTGHGTENQGRPEEESVDELAPTSRYVIRTLARTSVLCAVPCTPIELLQLQLEKLVVNTIINPLTSLLDNRNGSILYNFALSRTTRLMLAETSLIICSLPELRGLPNVPHRFSADRLESIVTNSANMTKDNISSMLADVRAGRQTEIEYINGYIVKRGEEMGIKAVVNYGIMQIVIGKSKMTQREYQESVPVEGQGEGVNRE